MAAEQQNGGSAPGVPPRGPVPGRPSPWWPRTWTDRITALVSGELTPVTPRRAATVMLVSDTEGPGIAVHMLRRKTSMAFAAGMYAYPGGAVDPRDEHADLRWAGPDTTVWADRLGCGPAEAQAVVCAAVRETFEESGVLLAGPDAGSVVADTSGDDWEAERAALAAHELSFAELLARRGLVLRSDLLGAWARWITPEFEERRYDTWFFACLLPEGQRARDVSGEADGTQWVRPAEAAARYDAGEMAMMPPTVSTLRQLATCSTAREVLAAAAHRDMTPVLATARRDGEDIVVAWPGHDEFTQVLKGRP